MLNFCTHCDNNYFYKGLALYKSLTEQCPEFTLHWLANDEDTFKQLERINLPNVKQYSLKKLEEENEDLRIAKTNPAGYYGTQWSQYCWSVTPYFINYILPSIQGKLIYCDSDIYFYRSPQIILDIVGDKSIGIHTHKFTPPFKDTHTGWYNVGVMVFENNAIGLEVSGKWKQWLLSTTHEYFAKYGTCGDQKYLDLFPELWKDDVCIFDIENCDHMAPWCCSPIVKSPMFFHFSHFNIDIEKGTWKDSNNGEWNPAREPQINKYYHQYNLAIRSMYDRYLR